ncbi:unnamed protein product [Parnassius mnemosyne]|uniref:COX assembly mitochondrial protein n=1 Tax=Parnassius mnemosyne TaxID=213953 RepID=A0AAV1KPJ1_9NEOP
MVVTEDVDLPSCSELTVPEVNLSTATLMSAGPYFGKDCEAINNEFMLCRYELDDPRACVNLGKKVTSCTMKFFKKVKENCLEEFNQYVNCVDKSSGNFSFSKCRTTQTVFDGCMKDKLNMERPDFGYFTRPRVHCSPSPAPESPPCPCYQKFPDATPSLPDWKPRPPARFGSRFYWMTE